MAAIKIFIKERKMAMKTEWKAPYVSAATLRQFLDHIRNVSIPKKVDAGLLLDYGISKGNVSALLSALKFLALVDSEGKPTAAFQGLQVVGDEFNSSLRNVVKAAYEDLFTKLDVSRDSRVNIRNYFARNYSTSQSEKATNLFIELCKEAGIPVAAASETATKGPGSKAAPSSVKRPLQPDREKPGSVTVHKVEDPRSEDELRRIYIGKLIDKLSTPDTAGKDAAAIQAEAELRRAELDRIEKLLGIASDKDDIK